MDAPWTSMRLAGDPQLAWHGAPGPAVERPGLVLLHGVTRCGHDLEPLVSALTATEAGIYDRDVEGRDRDRRAAADVRTDTATGGDRRLDCRFALVDQRGHGDSCRATRYLVTDYAADAARLIRSFGPCFVVGHSLGAMVAAQVAAELPALVRGAVLVDPPFHTMGERIAGSSWESLFVGLRDAARRGGTVQDLAAAIADIRLPDGATSAAIGRGWVRLGDVRDPAALRWHAECLARLDPEVLTPVIEGCWLDGYDPPAIAAATRCPLVLVQADPARGGALTDADAEAFAAAAPRCRIARMPGTGHALHREQPGRVAALVHELCARMPCT
jgi:pimeloyl-ACP methyl ester carboxylesterase